MSSSNYLRVNSAAAGATHGHHHHGSAQCIEADATNQLFAPAPPPSYNLAASHGYGVMQQHVIPACINPTPQEDPQQYNYFLQFGRADGDHEPKRIPANLSRQIIKNQGIEFHQNLDSQKSDISSDHAMAEAVHCSTTSTSAAAPLSWPLHHSTLLTQGAAISAHSVGDAVKLLAMAAGAEDFKRAKLRDDRVKAEELGKMENGAGYGYPQAVRASASMQAANLRLISKEYEQGRVSCSGINTPHPAEYVMQPTLCDIINPQTSRSNNSIDDHINADYHIRGNWLAGYNLKEMQQQFSGTPLIPAAADIVYHTGDQNQEYISSNYQKKAAPEVCFNFHAQKFDCEDGTNMAAASTKELLLLNCVQDASITAPAFEINKNFPHGANSTTTHDAESAGVAQMDTQQLLHRSSLRANNYNLVAASNQGYMQQLANQTELINAGDGHQLDIVANQNPSVSWDETHCKMGNHNIIPSFMMMPQAHVPTPASSMIGSVISGNNSLISNNSAAAHFSHQSIGGLARYIQPEDLSLGGPSSSDFVSLDCAYSRSGPISVLRTSKYLKPAQQLLEECCTNVKHDINLTRARAPHGNVESEELAHMKASLLASKNLHLSAEERCHLQMKKARLIGMVEELDRRYQQYQDQMQLITTSFESATGMGTAIPYTALAKKLISRQFRALRDAIGEHIQIVCRTLGEDISNVPVLNKGETPRLRILDQRLRHHRTLQQVGLLQQQQSWRPQRGLPERSVAVLRAWLFEHFLHPYPKDPEKLMLARLTGLTRSQVANWFINARVRLWKPMVEQIYAEESKGDDVSGQDAAEEGMTHNYGQQENITHAWNGSHLADNVSMQAEHSQNSEQLSYNSGKSTMSHNEITMGQGVSLTLGLQHASSVEHSTSSYIPNCHFNLHSDSGDVNYTFV